MTMATLGEVVARMRAALDSCGSANRHLIRADRDLRSAAESLAQALDGAHDRDATTLLSLAVDAVDATVGALAAARQGVQRQVNRLESDTVGGTRPAVPPGQNDTPSAERIEQLRSQLPPPVTRGSGQKTHGRWIAPGGTAQSVVSGRDELTERVNDVLRQLGCPTLPVIASADVEMKLATLMRDQGDKNPAMRHVTVVINHRPCKGRLGCESLLPVLLPEGYTLTVHGPNYRKRFTGGAKPWWR